LGGGGVAGASLRKIGLDGRAECECAGGIDGRVSGLMVRAFVKTAVCDGGYS